MSKTSWRAMVRVTARLASATLSLSFVTTRRLCLQRQNRGTAALMVLAAAQRPTCFAALMATTVLPLLLTAVLRPRRP